MRNHENLLTNQSGATVIEYAFIASGIALVLMAAILTLGGQLSGVFSALSAALS